MERQHGMYALVQYSPVPERLEFLNIGIVLFIHEGDYIGVRFSEGQSRIERAFGKLQGASYLNSIKMAYRNRLHEEWNRSKSHRAIAEFADKRANGVRLSPLMPIMIKDNPDVELDRLFLDLVGDDRVAHREPRIRKRLREALSKKGVVHLLDEQPVPVDLPELGVKIDAPFAYQNGCYNLVDGMRLSSNPNDSLREAGKRAFEGAQLWKHFHGGAAPKRLVVVADFAEQSDDFYRAVSDQFGESHVKLHRLDALDELVRDIKDNAILHA